MGLRLVPRMINKRHKLRGSCTITCSVCRRCYGRGLVLTPLFFSPVITGGCVTKVSFFVKTHVRSTVTTFSSRITMCPVTCDHGFGNLFLRALSCPVVKSVGIGSRQSVLLSVGGTCFRQTRLGGVVEGEVTAIITRQCGLLVRGLVAFFGV